jgi:hypothetical protein
MTGMGFYRWPLLHRPRVTRTARQDVDSRFTGPVPIPIITNFQPSLTSSLHHHRQFSTFTHLQPSPSTHQHINTPTHHPLTVETPRLPTSGQILRPLRARREKHSHQWRLLGFRPPPRLSTPLSAMTRCSNSHSVEETVYS